MLRLRKSILSIVLILAVLFSAVYVGVVALSNSQGTNILAGNTTAKIYRTNLATPLIQGSAYSALSYNNLHESAAMGDFIAWAEDINDKNNNSNNTEFLAYTQLGEQQSDLLNLLVEEDNTRAVKIEHSSGGAKPLSYRSGIAYDLGALYSLDSLVLEQKMVGNVAIFNFSVYAGNELDETIFQNKIGAGGSTTDNRITVELDFDGSARYILIMFDHVTATYNNIVNMYTYQPRLTGIELYGEQTGDIVVPLDILSGNTTGTLYRLHFTNTPLTQSQPYTPNYDTIKYDNMQLTSVDQYSWRAQTVVNGAYANAADQAAAMNLLTTPNNTKKVRFNSGSGSSTQLAYRVAILYDLGAYYELNALKLNIDNSACQIRNYSVYAGNEADLSLLDNRIGLGGTAVTSATETTAALTVTHSYRYVLIVFDHATSMANGNATGWIDGYVPTLTGVKLYGEKTAELVVPVDILSGNTTGATFRLHFKQTPMIQSQPYTPNYDTIEYDSIESTSVDQYSWRAQTYVSGNYSYASDQAATINLLTTANNTEKVRFHSGASSPTQLAYRLAILYDLEAYYNLTDLELYVDNSACQIRNYSVYAGNTPDLSLLDNRIGLGGSAVAGDTKLPTELTVTDNYRYVLIVFDHATSMANGSATGWNGGYVPTLTAVKLYGEKTGDVVVPVNILNGNKNGTLYNIMLDTPYVTGESWYKQNYNNLTPTAMSGDFVFYQIDSEDLNQNGNTTERVKTSSIGKTNAQVLEDIASDDNTEYYEIEHTTGAETPNKYRVAIGYDLGAYYDIDNLVFLQNISVGRVIFKTSVYAGNQMDETIFNNCVGTGDEVKADNTTTIKIDGAKSVRYILLVLDHVTANANKDVVNQYAYYPRLVNISCYGSRVGEIIPEVKRESILKNNKSGALYSILLEQPYEHQKEVTIDYSTLKYTNLTLAQKADQYPFLTYRYDEAWTKKDESESLALLTKEGNEEKIKIQHGRGGDVPLKFRVGIMYDLGNWYDVDSIALTVDNATTQIRNFSVYAGNSVNALIFNNRVGTGGSLNPSATTLKSTLKNAVAVRYIFIVFDHVSNFDFANQHGYTPFLKQIEAYGEINPNPPKDAGNPYGTNILLNNKSGRIYQVSGYVPHNIEYKPDYNTLVYTNLYDSNLRYRRYGTDFEKTGENDPSVYEDPSLKIATDGKTDQKILINTGTDRSSGFVEEKRIAIIYDLGGWYDLSTVVLKQDLASSSAIRNFSVYAGAFGDSRILENRVGVGGGAYESLVSNLTGATSVRYLVIVLDNVTNITNNLSNYYQYRPFITEIECYGKLNKNPVIPVDTKATDILESGKATATMIFVKHDFSWSDSFEKGSYDYKSGDYEISSEISSTTFEAWTDGKGDTMAYWSSGISAKYNITKRKGVLFDLGGFYDISDVEIDVAAVTGDRRYVYDYTVYGSAVNDGSILSNLIGHGGSTEEMLSSKITYNKSVRYVLIMFNKLGTDPGNLNDSGTQSLASKVDKTGALPGCTWADSGIYLGEVSIYGKEGTDTTSKIDYTDEDSGVKVEVITYDNDVTIESIKINRKPVSELHKSTISLDAMYPLGDSYNIEFFDKDGNKVTDMKGRQFKVYFPMYYGDEACYVLNADGTIEQIDLALDMDNNMLVYSSSPEKQYYDFIIASFTNPETEDAPSDKETDVKKDKTDREVDVVLIVVISVACAIVIGSVLWLVIFLKRRNKQFI